MIKPKSVKKIENFKKMTPRKPLPKTDGHDLVYKVNESGMGDGNDKKPVIPLFKTERKLIISRQVISPERGCFRWLILIIAWINSPRSYKVECSFNKILQWNNLHYIIYFYWWNTERKSQYTWSAAINVFCIPKSSIRSSTFILMLICVILLIF